MSSRKPMSSIRSASSSTTTLSASSFSVPRAKWLELIEKERGISPKQYADDILWPMLSLRALARGAGEPTEAELRAAFEKQYGPAVKARIIVSHTRAEAESLRTRALAPSITSVVKVRHLVVAGTSNWGAWGVVAELSRLAGRPLLHSAEDERRMVEACVAAGAVDGITRQRAATVDGLPLAAHVGMLELLRLFIPPGPTGGPTP